MSSTDPARPAWLERGVKVVLWTTGSPGIPPGYAIGVVERINPKTFTVRSSSRTDEPRFPLAEDGMTPGSHGRRSGGPYGVTRHCARADSALGREIAAKRDEFIARARARTAIAGFLEAGTEGDADLAAAKLVIESLHRYVGARTAYPHAAPTTEDVTS